MYYLVLKCLIDLDPINILFKVEEKKAAHVVEFWSWHLPFGGSRPSCLWKKYQTKKEEEIIS